MTIDDTPHPPQVPAEDALSPRFEFAFETRLTLAPRLVMDNPPSGGQRMSVPVVDGRFEGPRLRGRVLNHGGEFPHVRTDGVFCFDARYFMQEDDGTLIYIQNRGFRHGPPDVMETLLKLPPGMEVDPRSYYLRCTPTFETPPGKHDWLTRHVFVGVGARLQSGNVIRYYQLL